MLPIKPTVPETIPAPLTPDFSRPNQSRLQLTYFGRELHFELDPQLTTPFSGGINHSQIARH
ncbi:MAG: hypothetical protein HQL49_10725, partial [Gammaproteobacteria bacterium]|nr:hypothetical protein [Gammaproteobacteria bacterium]